MKIIFMGTPEFSVPFLETLYQSAHQVLMVITQPDKSVGRGKKIKPPPVKKAAKRLGIDVFQTDQVNNFETQTLIKKLQPDLIVTVAFGQKLSRALLDIPYHGAVNVHASLLPEYRGAAPIQRAIMEGKKQTGVTIMQMNENMDAGDILHYRVIDIDPRETAGEIYQKMLEVGPDLLLETLDLIENNEVVPEKQDEAKATYAPKLTRVDENIDFESASAEEIYNQVRALNPQPGAFITCGEERVKVWECQVIDPETLSEEEKHTGPGQVVKMTKNGPIVKCREGFIMLTRVQFACKKPISGKDLYCGKQLEEGMCLG